MDWATHDAQDVCLAGIDYTIFPDAQHSRRQHRNRSLLKEPSSCNLLEDGIGRSRRQCHDNVCRSVPVN
jgi:hypothetical protein